MATQLADRLPVIFLMSLAAILCAAIGWYSYRLRRKVGRAGPFALMAFSATLWIILETINACLQDPQGSELLWGLKPFVIRLTLIALLNFCLLYSLRLKKISRRHLFGLGAISLVLFLFEITNPLHHLYYTASVQSGLTVRTLGIIYYLHFLYVYAMALICLGLLARALIFSAGVARSQTVLMVIGMVVTMAVSAVADLNLWDPLPYVEETALSLVFPVVAFAIVTFRYHIFSLLPVAYDLIIQHIHDGVLVLDAEEKIILSNPAVLAVLGRETRVVGLPIRQVLGDWQPEALQAWVDGLGEVQLTNRTQTNFYRMTTTRMTDGADEIIGTLLVFYNITIQKGYEDSLSEMARQDVLTACYNRRYFFEVAQDLFMQATGANSLLSVLMIDLDHFKNINDTYGHSTGDQVLQGVGAACRGQIRSRDVLARYGGEEFVLVLPGATAEVAMTVAERLRKTIEGVGASMNGIPVTASIGVASMAPGLDDNLDQLLARADEAMYHSKNAGRNRVTAWEVWPQENDGVRSHDS